MTIPSRQTLIDQAVKDTGYSDFGDTWFFDNLDALIPALNDEAQLSEAGVYGASAMIAGALSTRLRHKALIKANPEILDEEVNVSAVVTGLPRTGSTMLHRLLASCPQMTGVRWYETQNYAPLPGEIRGDPAPRRAAAEGILGYMLQVIPDLMSIHPMSIEQPDEEVIILGQLFSSSMMEASYYVPSFAKWLDGQDAAPAYADLIEIIKSLQWQDKSRASKSWVLKTPGHLMALGTTLDAFPDAKIVMTHRDPVATVPSYCSMEASLYKMGSDNITHEMIGDFIPARLADWLDRFMKVRAGADEDRFVDIFYKDQLTDPVAQCEKVLNAVGVPMTDEIRGGFDEWIEANKREHRAPHKYSLEDFGLTESGIREQFADYMNAYIGET